MNISDIRDRLDHITNLMSEVASDFAVVIADKSIPLAERWELFSNAPAEFRDTDGYIWQPEALKSLGRHPWEYFTFCERYRYIDLVEIINDNYDLSSADEEQFGVKVTRQVVEELVEEMLQSNTAGFTYDW